MNNSKMMIEEGMKQLDIMKYMLDTNQHEYFTILTDDDYVEIDRLICRGMKKDLAISHVAIMREFKSLKIKPRMKVSTTKEQILQRLQEMESFSAKVDEKIFSSLLVNWILPITFVNFSLARESKRSPFCK
jgi:hypothetical protein